MKPVRSSSANALLRALLDAVPDPSIIVASGIIVASNPAARNLLGHWIDGEDVRLAIRHPAALERLGASKPERSEIEITGLGGPERHWTMATAPLDRKTIFLRLSDRSAAYAAERMRGDFVANASHELRTPLATLVGYAETLREQGDGIDDSTRARFTAIIHDEALRMQRLVEDLISLSRIEAERFSAPRDAVDLRDLIDEAVLNCRVSAEARGCRLLTTGGDELPPVAGDRAQLLQLLENLIGNALRYGRQGGPVRISMSSLGDMVELAVSDEGEGIAPEYIPRLTERFYRVDPGRSRALGGTGLGLAIVKHIVERHRGRLSIESRIGEGTRVGVLLPVADGAS